MLHKSYRLRVALWSCLISGLVLLIYLGGVTLMVKYEYSQLVDYDAEALAAAILQGSGGEGYRTDPFREIMGFEKGSYRGSIYDDTEDLDYKEQNIRLLAIRHANGEYAYRNELYWSDAYAEKLDENFVLDLGKELKPVSGTQNDDVVGQREERWEARRYTKSGNAVYIALNQHEHQDEYLELIQLMSAALPVALLVVALGGWWLGVYAVKPVKNISRIVDSISPDDLEKRIAEAQREDEIGELARLINAMLDRIQEGYQQAKRFTADASHELRTPLAIIQAELESKMRESEKNVEFCSPILEEVSRLKALTHSLLFLSKADSGTLDIAKEPVAIVPLIKQIIEDLREIEQARDLTFEYFDQGEDALVEGDPLLIQQMILNLMRNAIKFNRAGGRVRCQVAHGPQSVKIVIGNTGRGIEPDERGKVFERFYRSSKSRDRASGGFGLGLNIVQSIAEVHGGEVFLLSCGEDWTEFELELPTSARRLAAI